MSTNTLGTTYVPAQVTRPRCKQQPSPLLHVWDRLPIKMGSCLLPGAGFERLCLQKLQRAQGYRPNRVNGRLQQQVLCTAVGRLSGGDDAAADIGLEERVAAMTTIINAFYKFTRPHTMMGTFISVCSVSLMAAGSSYNTTPALTALTQALVPALLMNVCIVGINQLFDVEIDKVNKPYLPLASGEFSMFTGLAIVISTGIASLLIGGAANSPPLMATLVGSLALGIAYSIDLPFLRWKRFPVVAASCILAVRAVMVQLGFYFHMKLALGARSLALTTPLLFAMSFMLFVSIVIALFKDIPDIKGDSRAGVRTLSVRLGTKCVFWLCIALLEIAYAGAIGVGLSSQVWWSKVGTVAIHALFGGLLYKRAKETNLQNSKSIYSCYMFVWKLFYAEYLLIPFLR